MIKHVRTSNMSQASPIPEEDGAGTGGPEIKISQITSEDVYSLWPPKDMVTTPEMPPEVKRKLGRISFMLSKLDSYTCTFYEFWSRSIVHALRLAAFTFAPRPHLWLQHDDQDYVGTEDVGRFVKLTRNDLLEQLPEGARRL